MSGGSFGSPASGSLSATPKPFVIQPASNSQWAASNTSADTSNAASSSSNHGDQEQAADDTKSELVDSRKGEEDERTLYEVRAKLFGTDNNEHKDLGIGQFRVNEHTVTKKRRMIMRIGGTGLITINSESRPLCAGFISFFFTIGNLTANYFHVVFARSRYTRLDYSGITATAE